MISTEERLKIFQDENNIYTKGPLSLVVQFTRLVQDKEFPLNPDDFQTSSKGQVAGLGGGNLKKILREHGITQQLSAEGGHQGEDSLYDHHSRSQGNGGGHSLRAEGGQRRGSLSAEAPWAHREQIRN